MDPLTDRKTYRTNMTPSHLKSLKRTSLLSFFLWLCDRPLILGEALEIIFLTKGPSLRSTSEPSQTLSIWRRRKFLATKPSLWMSTSGEWEMFAKHVRDVYQSKAWRDPLRWQSRDQSAGTEIRSKESSNCLDLTNSWRFGQVSCKASACSCFTFKNCWQSPRWAAPGQTRPVQPPGLQGETEWLKHCHYQVITNQTEEGILNCKNLFQQSCKDRRWEKEADWKIFTDTGKIPKSAIPSDESWDDLSFRLETRDSRYLTTVSWLGRQWRAWCWSYLITTKFDQPTRTRVIIKLKYVITSLQTQ